MRYLGWKILKVSILGLELQRLLKSHGWNSVFVCWTWKIGSHFNFAGITEGSVHPLTSLCFVFCVFALSNFCNCSRYRFIFSTSWIIWFWKCSWYRFKTRAPWILFYILGVLAAFCLLACLCGFTSRLN